MVTDLIDRTLTRFPRFASGDVAVEPLEKGGSDRKFYRVRAGEASLILAKYGSQREENRHYVAIARFLVEIHVRVPEIYFHDESEGLIWMEDLGDRDLWSYRNEPWPVRRRLYHDALDQALTLHIRAHAATPVEPPKFQAEFNAELYRWEQNYFLENCLGRVFGIGAEVIDERGIRERLSEIAASLHLHSRVLVHRDFQSQNIVIKGGRACFIDFQGMRPGLVQYDLASLLYDPYVSLSSEEREELLNYYLTQWSERGGEIPADFAQVYDQCAMQRLMQALGAYGFLGLVKERPHFLEHIPVALRSLRAVVERIPGLESLSGLLASLPSSGMRI